MKFFGHGGGYGQIAGSSAEFLDFDFLIYNLF
jgi:hypothetical protein